MIFFSVFLRVSRFALTKIFENKNCVSIDSKCSETRKNVKKKKKKKKMRVARISRKFSKKKCLNRLEMQ